MMLPAAAEDLPSTWSTRLRVSSAICAIVAGRTLDAADRLDHAVDDAGDLGLEAAGEAREHLAALLGGVQLALLVLLLQATYLERVRAEHFERVRHVADLVLARLVGHLDLELPFRELLHGARRDAQRPRHREAEEDRERAADDEVRRPSGSG